MAKQLEEVRTHLTNELGLQEPPNLELGLYYNVYLHDPSTDEDGYEEDWGNTVTNDEFEIPYMALSRI